MSFRDLDELLGRPAKELPIRGRVHTFPDRISAESGLVLLRLSQHVKADPDPTANAQAIASELLDEAGWVALQAEVLGRPAEEFIGEGLTGEEVAHVMRTLIVWHLHGLEAAEAAWEAVGNAQGPTNRQTRRSKAAATSSPRRASPASSTTRAPRKRAPRSAGPSS